MKNVPGSETIIDEFPDYLTNESRLTANFPKDFFWGGKWSANVAQPAERFWSAVA